MTETEKKKDEFLKSYAYLSLVYSKMGKYELAVKYGKSALRGSQLLKDETVKGHAMLFLARSYLHLDKQGLAERYFLNAYKVMKKLRIKIGQGYTLQGLGQIYSDKCDYQKAIKILKRSADIFKDLGMEKDLSDVKKLLRKLSDIKL